MYLLYIIPNPSAQAGCNTRSIFKQNLTDLNLEFSFSKSGCHANDLSLSNYLLIAGFILFWRILVQCEKQTASSRIWTRVTKDISYDNDYSTTRWGFFCGGWVSKYLFRMILRFVYNVNTMFNHRQAHMPVIFLRFSLLMSMLKWCSGHWNPSPNDFLHIPIIMEW